jgi:mono/diheme cytochrome c family protein
LKRSFCYLLAMLALSACHSKRMIPPASEVVSIIAPPEELPDLGGDPEKGFEYIFYGDYIKSGYPLKLALGDAYDPVRVWDRDTIKTKYGNAVILFRDRHNTSVMSGSCMTCHGAELNGQFYPGLGEAFGNYTKKPNWKFKLTDRVVRRKLGKNSQEYQSFRDIWQFQKEVSPRIVTPFVGPNPAFRLEEACVAFREPSDLHYTSKAQFEIKGETPAADVPPLWHVGKKRTLYYNGMGRGNFSKLLMQASVLGVKDSSEAREVWRQFRDVVAWAAQLKPPAFPSEINTELALQGKMIFGKNCSKCHGTYGDEVSYPNKIIPLEKVGTDPYYAQYFARQSGLAGWYNKSWFGKSEPSSSLQPSLGYVAPPLDGIWATAPYLHNGSVPTLENLLDSKSRPEFWQRDTVPDNYNTKNVGWKFISHPKPINKNVYDTSKKGFNNKGHTYGDKLSTEERKAVIEYLKTL